jgi:hypothetical protein
MSERAVEIARAAIQKVFKNGGETTVTLPKGWSVHISASRAVKEATELNVLLISILQNVEEPLYYRKLTSVEMNVNEPFLAYSYVGGVAISSVTVNGRFKIKVAYREEKEGVIVAEIEVKKV